MAASDDSREERLLTGYSGRIAVLLATGWTATLLGRQVLPPLLPTIIEDLSLSPARAGAALTLTMALYSLLQYPAGRLSDGLSRTTVLAASLGVMVAGLVALSGAGSYLALLAGTGLLGAGAGLFFSPARAFLSDLFVARRGQAYGMQTVAGMVGSGLAAGVAVLAVRYASWQAAFLPAIVLLLAVLVALHRVSDEGYVLGSVPFAPRTTVARVLADRGVRRLLVTRTILGFTLQAVVGFLPTFLGAERGFGTVLASGAFALVYAVGVVAGPVGGRLSDRARRPVLVGAPALTAAGVGLLVVARSPPGILAGVALAAAGTWAFFPAVNAALMDGFPDATVGGDFGVAKAIYTGLGSLGPTYVGVVAGAASYTLAFAGLIPALLCGVGLLVLPRR